MARRVVWTEPAADDLVETVEYIARDSPAFAATLAQRVCDAGDSLAELSERGRPLADPLYPGWREFLVGPYRLVYEVQADRVVIHGVVHGRRDAAALLRKRGAGEREDAADEGAEHHE
jgi:plasmid stabilization system protein ParE